MATYHRQDGTIEFTNKQGALVGRLAGTKLTDVEVYRIAAHWWTPSWRAVVATAIALATRAPILIAPSGPSTTTQALLTLSMPNSVSLRLTLS